MDGKDQAGIRNRIAGGDQEINYSSAKEIFTVNPEAQLKRIHDKLQQLLKQSAALQKENARLKDQLRNMESAAAVQHDTVETLKQQTEILKYSAGEMNAADKKEFEKRVNFYIKEIDRCIALLGN